MNSHCNKVSGRQQEDTWAWVEIGEPFPDGPMRVKGQQNQYVALWYKHGQPICGRAWNNNGVVECSFGFLNYELTGKKDLGGKIQILTYEHWKDPIEAWRQCGYWYEWVPWIHRRKNNCALVRCGDAAPILALGSDGSTYCGNIKISDETVTWGQNRKCETQNTKVENLLTLVRCFCEPPPPAQLPKTKDNLWGDVKEGDDWSRVGESIAGMGRPLNGPIPGSHVALWYCDGNPIFGAAWSEGGRIKATFGARGHEYRDKIGSMQILTYDPNRQSFDIMWRQFKDCKTGGWSPCRVADCAPCVIISKKGEEHLGRVLISEEKASYPEDGKEVVFVGPQVQNFYVLCRTP